MNAGQIDARSRSDPARFGIPLALLTAAAVGWWWSVRMAGDMSMGSDAMGGMSGMSGMKGMSQMSHDAMSFGAFLLAWLAMMTAMMFPAISPVVRLYSRGAAAGRVAPLPFFVAGYIVVWTSIGIPAFFAWRALMEPLAGGRIWAARLAGGVLIAAAVWQLTPMKSVCLRHCRCRCSCASAARRPSRWAQRGWVRHTASTASGVAGPSWLCSWPSAR
jgi:predicted metal-binding membrane protein